jgi:hypothetical protein
MDVAREWREAREAREKGDTAFENSLTKMSAAYTGEMMRIHLRIHSYTVLIHCTHTLYTAYFVDYPGFLTAVTKMGQLHSDQVY